MGRATIRNWLGRRPAEAIPARIRRERSGQFPVLLLEPDLQSASQLASRLQAAGFEVRIEVNAQSSLRTIRKSFFFALVVVADLTDKSCLAALRALRHKAMRSWMIVATPCCDVQACKLIHRCGGDACVTSPISAEDLIDRLDAFRLRPRPTF